MSVLFACCMSTDSLSIWQSSFTEGESSNMSCMETEELDTEALGDDGMEEVVLYPRKPAGTPSRASLSCLRAPSGMPSSRDGLTLRRQFGEAATLVGGLPAVRKVLAPSSMATVMLGNADSAVVRSGQDRCSWLPPAEGEGGYPPKVMLRSKCSMTNSGSLYALLTSDSFLPAPSGSRKSLTPPRFLSSGEWDDDSGASRFLV